jgi:cyanate permease
MVGGDRRPASATVATREIAAGRLSKRLLEHGDEGGHRFIPEVAPPHGGRTWRSALAWQVTLLLGLNSIIYYTVITWLPAILTDAGYSIATAGSLHGLSQLATAIPGLIVGPIVGRLKDQKALAFGLSAFTGLSVLGLILSPQIAVLWVVAFGASAGAVFILGLAFISLRSANAHQAAALSAMAQFVGYLLAAVAPPVIGSTSSRFRKLDGAPFCLHRPLHRHGDHGLACWACAAHVQ